MRGFLGALSKRCSPEGCTAQRGPRSRERRARPAEDSPRGRSQGLSAPPAQANQRVPSKALIKPGKNVIDGSKSSSSLTVSLKKQFNPLPNSAQDRPISCSVAEAQPTWLDPSVRTAIPRGVSKGRSPKLRSRRIRRTRISAPPACSPTDAPPDAPAASELTGGHELPGKRVVIVSRPVTFPTSMGTSGFRRHTKGTGSGLAAVPLPNSRTSSPGPSYK